MNQERYNRLLKQLSGTAEKVYSAVPQNEDWTIRQIITEMKRLTGTNPDYSIVQGCLNTLTTDGLIRNVGGMDRWQRITPSVTLGDPMKGALAVALESMEKVPTKAIAQPPFDPVHRLTRLALVLMEAAEEIEGVVKMINDERATEHGDSIKLKALKALLGDL